MSSNQPISLTLRVKNSNQVHPSVLRNTFKESNHITFSYNTIHDLHGVKCTSAQRKSLAMPGLKIVFHKDKELLLVVIAKSKGFEYDYPELVKLKHLTGKQVGVTIKGEKIEIREVIKA